MWHLQTWSDTKRSISLPRNDVDVEEENEFCGSSAKMPNPLLNLDPAIYKQNTLYEKQAMSYGC